MVDDKATLCFAMREYFNLYNYQVDCAHDLEKAATLLNASRYAVVIADLDLGEIHNVDGFEVIRTVRERFPGTRIIVLTAYGSAEIKAEAREFGACLCREDVYTDDFALKHTSTFAGNTLACRVGLATLDLLEESDRHLIRQVAVNGARLKQELQYLKRRRSNLIDIISGRGHEFGATLDRSGCKPLQGMSVAIAA